MAIRVQHEIGGMGGLAAYASGAGKRQERQRKYALDLYRDERLAEERRANLQQQHQWEVEMQDKRQIFDLAESRMKRNQDIQDRMQDRQWALQDQRTQRDWITGREEQQWRREQDVRLQEQITSGDMVLEGWAEGKLRDAEAKYAEAANSGRYTQPQLDMYRNQLEDYMGNIRRIGSKAAPQGVDAVNQNQAVIDPKTQQFRKPNPGERPTHTVVNGQAIENPAVVEERERKAMEAEQKREAIKNRDERMRELQKEEREMDLKASPDVDDDVREKYRQQMHSEMDSITVDRMLDDPRHVDRATSQFIQFNGRVPTRAELEEFVRRGVASRRAGPTGGAKTGAAGSSKPTATGTPPATATGKPASTPSAKPDARNTLNELVAAAKAGDADARRVCEEKGIPWQ
jgi:hypothetical protein